VIGAVDTVVEFSTEPDPDDSLTEVLGSQAPEMRFSSSFHKGEPPVSKGNLGTTQDVATARVSPPQSLSIFWDVLTQYY
jgi:hypothetical protein